MRELFFQGGVLHRRGLPGYGEDMKRLRICASGQVQGVGFRPFVYRQATNLDLCGQVGNTAEGVVIEIQGKVEALAEFMRRLREEPPPLARITDLDVEDVDSISGTTGFAIVESAGGSGHAVLISPDVGLCDDCLRELYDPADRRYLYPFINCTNCGPRYTITHSIPYDRERTSMACFPLCAACAAEYADPANRRFHAEPVACPVCGPQVWLTDGAGDERASQADAVRQCARLLADGQIVALRGLGGFHLACDASNETAVARLRERKQRPHKALAVMVADMDDIGALADVDAAEAALLQSPARPIVLLSRKPGVLPENIAPDTDRVGLVLAYTPLHHVLLHQCGELGVRALVMTSGNPSGEPLCLGNREALARLGEHADAFLLHNRDILIRADDSVVRVMANMATDIKQSTQCIRRARGYTPSPLPLPRARGGVVLATGADMKAAPALSRGANAFVSQYVGDLENPAVTAFYESTVAHLSKLLDVQPAAVVADLHPRYFSGRFAESYAAEHGVPLYRVQHHEAHAHAVLGEHGHEGPALGLLLDGTGYGPDKTIWGGELLLLWPGEAAVRVGRLAPFPLSGGDKAVREPWRVAVGLAVSQGMPVPERLGYPQAPHIAEAVRAGVVPLTSSCGRLFDAVSAALGLCPVISYEGQAAMRLEAAQDCTTLSFDSAEAAPVHESALLELDCGHLFRQALNGDPVPVAARRFHLGLVAGLARMVRIAAERCGIRTVALGGGVLQNGTVAQELPPALRALGLTPLLPRLLPPGDGAISYGQLVWLRRQNSHL